jgi:hypothetical protein
MPIVSDLIDLFRAPSPERQKQKHLRIARLELEEAEIGVEDYVARREKLKARVTRLEADLNHGRPTRSSIQAPCPAPDRTNVGAFTVPDARMRGAQA